MARNTSLLALAISSTFIHVCVTIFLIRMLIVSCLAMTDPYRDKRWDGLSILFIISYTIPLVTEIAVLVACIFLIAGIEKEHDRYITPWIYLMVVYTIFSFLNLMITFADGDVTFSVKLIIITLQAIIWCLVLRYWWKVKAERQGHLIESSPLNFDYTTQTPGTFYRAGPGHYQQGQFVANNYPPPCYPYHMQTGVNYYPAQNYPTGFIQPIINHHHVANASYPGQMTISSEGIITPPTFEKCHGIQQ